VMPGTADSRGRGPAVEDGGDVSRFGAAHRNSRYAV
jgi:hypothetical protein